MESRTRLIICAWCGERQGGSLEPASHGICPECARTFLAQAEAMLTPGQECSGRRHQSRARHRLIPYVLRAAVGPAMFALGAAFMGAAFARHVALRS